MYNIWLIGINLFVINLIAYCETIPPTNEQIGDITPCHVYINFKIKFNAF